VRHALGGTQRRDGLVAEAGDGPGSDLVDAGDDRAAERRDAGREVGRDAVGENDEVPALAGLEGRSRGEAGGGGRAGREPARVTTVEGASQRDRSRQGVSIAASSASEERSDRGGDL